MTEKDSLESHGMHHGAKPEVFRIAAKLRNNMTEPEKKLWEYLRTKPKGYKFRRQHPISNYILDFYCHKLKLSIEVDGTNHLTKKQREIDNQRTEYLKSLGIKEFRFTNEEILNQFEQSIEYISSLLSSGSPSEIQLGDDK